LTKKNAFDVLCLSLVLITVLFSFSAAGAHQVSPGSVSRYGDAVTGQSFLGVLALTPANRVGFASDVDGCVHPFVDGQASWECHHNVPAFLISSLVFIQGIMSSGEIVHFSRSSALSFCCFSFAPSSSHLSPLDHPPRVS
jgi:hypothetical protein